MFVASWLVSETVIPPEVYEAVIPSNSASTLEESLPGQ